MIRADDSLFTLTPGQIAGVLALSGALALLALALVRWPASRAARLAMAAAAFWVLIWLSPQVYYGLYRLMLEDLPGQGVIGPPPGPAHLAALLGFAGSDSLSAHGQGLLGWGLLGAALWPKRKPRGRALRGASPPRPPGYLGQERGGAGICRKSGENCAQISADEAGNKPHGNGLTG